MKRLYLTPIIMIISGIIFSTIAQENEINQTMQKKFEPILKYYMKDRKIPGFSIAVVKDKKVVYKKAFGVKNMDTNEKLTSTSLFHQASLTKPFVAS